MYSLNNDKAKKSKLMDYQENATAGVVDVGESIASSVPNFVVTPISQEQLHNPDAAWMLRQNGASTTAVDGG